MITITNIEYIANLGTLNIVADGPLQYTTRINESNNQFIIEIQDAILPPKLKRPFITKEFQMAPYLGLQAYQKSGSAFVNIVFQLKQNSDEPELTISGNSIIISPQGFQDSASEAVAEESFDAEEVEDLALPEQGSGDSQALASKTLDEFLLHNNKFYGRPINLQMDHVDVKNVIQFIAEESGSNIVLSDKVNGVATFKLRNVPWDQALVIVLKTHNLGYVRQGNVIRIATLRELDREAKMLVNSRKIQETLSPVEVKVFTLSFMDVKSVQNTLAPFLSEAKGKLVIDERSSSIIVTDTADVLRKVEKLIRHLDQEPQQVLIEGKLVEVTDDFNSSFGINWSSTGKDIDIGDKFARGTIGSDVITQGAIGNLNLTVGTINFIGNLTSRLRIEESKSTAKVISSPRILTLNKEEGVYTQKGETLSTNVTTSNGTTTTSVDRQPLELKLKVTPQITADNSIIMDFTVKRQFASASITTSGSNAQPIHSREASSKVIVKNGETAVIGGAYQAIERNSEAGVPGLMSIPFLGWLFKGRTKVGEKTELLIFLTPKILKSKGVF